VKTRRQWIWPIGLVLLVVAVAVVVFVLYRTPNRDSVAELVGALAALTAVAGSVAAGLLTRMRRNKAPSFLSLDHAADALAEQVRQQWKLATRRHGLISVRWEWCPGVTGPVTAAVGGAGGTPFPPLPGMAVTPAEKLRDGTIEDLFDVYGGLASGRLVILGKPGAGKSNAAIRLLLDVLAHRATFENPTERARVPVPVLFTLHGWDPNSERLADWLAARLARDYALVRAREYGPDAAARLINDDYLAVILDGLDEIAEELRPAALQALDEQANFRLVLVTRSKEMANAVSKGHLREAAALELCPLEAKQAADYLASAQLHPAPPGPWQRLVEYLRADPDSVLAQALDTPLMVSLVRDTYRPNDPVDELTVSECSANPECSANRKCFPEREIIEDHLLDRLLTAAYNPRPGHPAPTYTPDQTRQWLGNLARRMNDDDTRDLAWWQIPHWVPAWRRVAATVCAYVFVVGLVLASLVVLARVLVSTLGLPFSIKLEGGVIVTIVSKLGLALTIGPIIGLMSALGEKDFRYLRWLQRSKTENIRENLTAGLLYGFTFGLAGGLVIGFEENLMDAIVYGLEAGLVVGLAVGLVGTFGERPPRHLDRPRWRKTDIPINLALVLGTGLMAGLVYGLIAGHGFRDGSVFGLATALLTLVVTLLVTGPSAEATAPIDPCSSWRWNRRLGFFMGLLTALIYGLGEVFFHGLQESLVVGLFEALAVGIAVGLIFPATWQYAFASTQLWRKRETPADLLGFLEDARDRQILRTVGQVYQFRHAQLQDLLAKPVGASGYACHDRVSRYPAKITP
jgi:hypothetical protein